MPKTPSSAANIVGVYHDKNQPQEIAAEGVTRNLPGFSRFLEVAALGHGKMINYASVASDSQVSKSTVTNYYQVLENTLLASRLEPYWRSTSGFEVDFVLNDKIAIEVKAKKVIAERDLRSLRAIMEEAPQISAVLNQTVTGGYNINGKVLFCKRLGGG